MNKLLTKKIFSFAIIFRNANYDKKNDSLIIYLNNKNIKKTIIKNKILF